MKNSEETGALSGWEGCGERLGREPPEPGLTHLAAPLPKVDQKQQVKGLKPSGSWWPRAQLTETGHPQPSVPIGSCIRFTTISPECTAGTLGVRSPQP